MNRTDTARRLFSAGDLKEALAIVKTFKFGFTVEEKRVIEIAYESLIGGDAFYKQLKIDTAAMIAQSKEIIELKLFTF